MNRTQLDQLAREWRLRLTARELMSVTAGVCFGLAIGAFWLRAEMLLLLAFVAFAAGAVVRLFRSKPWRVDAAVVARHLDRAFPELEESSALWLVPRENLTLVQRLQRSRADDAARHLNTAAGASFAAAPRDLLRAPALWLGAAVAFLVALTSWRLMDQPPGAGASRETAVPAAPITGARENARADWPRIRQAELVISPPVYTERPERRVTGLNAEVEEGAQITWLVRLDRAVTELGLRFGASDAHLLPLEQHGDGTSRGRRELAESAVYTLAGMTAEGAAWRPHDVYSLKVIKDHAPQLKIVQPAAPRTEISPQAQRPVAMIEAVISDDYAVADAHLVATVAKGTGEAVKFREQKIAFDSHEPVEQPANGRRFTKAVDLLALGLEPGDEFYFHVEATDNRQPASNRARSETRFIVLKGADQSVTTPGTAIAGVNLVPQYFRSQRQIIIDTEKLIEDQPTLSASEFRTRANNLAIDQQLLRQRYGEFLGEEADHGELAATAHREEEHETHSADDWHGHAHASPPAAPSTQGEAAAQFGHQHDSQDEATLFDRETKGTIRQALGAMWEAERLLRMARPGEALGPENRALEIIKALQQADRSYVQRVGFEAAPIDFGARRLRGETAEVPERSVSDVAAVELTQAEADVREMLQRAPWTRDGRSLETREREALRRIESVLAERAQNGSELSLGALTQIRRVTAGDALASDEQLKLEAALLQLLSPATKQPKRLSEIAPSLAESYSGKLNPTP